MSAFREEPGREALAPSAVQSADLDQFGIDRDARLLAACARRRGAPAPASPPGPASTGSIRPPGKTQAPPWKASRNCAAAALKLARVARCDAIAGRTTVAAGALTIARMIRGWKGGRRRGRYAVRSRSFSSSSTSRTSSTARSSRSLRRRSKATYLVRRRDRLPVRHRVRGLRSSACRPAGSPTWVRRSIACGLALERDDRALGHGLELRAAGRVPDRCRVGEAASPAAFSTLVDWFPGAAARRRCRPLERCLHRGGDRDLPRRLDRDAWRAAYPKPRSCAGFTRAGRWRTSRSGCRVSRSPSGSRAARRAAPERGPPELARAPAAVRGVRARAPSRCRRSA